MWIELEPTSMAASRLGAWTPDAGRGKVSGCTTIPVTLPILLLAPLSNSENRGFVPRKLGADRSGRRRQELQASGRETALGEQLPVPGAGHEDAFRLAEQPAQVHPRQVFHRRASREAPRRGRQVGVPQPDDRNAEQASNSDAEQAERAGRGDDDLRVPLALAVVEHLEEG